MSRYEQLVLALVAVLFASQAWAGDLPINARLRVRFSSTLSSDSCGASQKVTGTLDKAVSGGGEILAPKGSLVEALVECNKSTTREDVDRIEITLLTVKGGGKNYSVVTSTVTLFGRSNGSPTSDATYSAIGAGMDRVLGNIHDKVGDTPSVGLPLGNRSVSSGKHVKLPANSRLTFSLITATAI